MTFADKVVALGTGLCVGLDPDFSRLPVHLRDEPEPFFCFNRALIDATAPYAVAYKPQFAHYAGQDRLVCLRATCEYIREVYPEKLLILDAKRNDIGSTAAFYAREAFGIYRADAVTINPYLGGDSLEPFTEDPRRGIFLLCKTSNPGSGELQNRDLDGKPLYQRVAEMAAGSWNQHNNIGLVVGATYPEEMRAVRNLAPTLPFLVPGIGAQGGDLTATLQAGAGAPLMINSSRGIIYAGEGEDFAEKAARAAEALANAIDREGL